MAGRPKMTEQEKQAAKEAREAAKNGAGDAADRAEARSANGKPPKAAAAPAASSQNTDDLDLEEKKLFIHHLPLVKAAREAVNSATSNLRNIYKRAKAEGNFTKADFDTAFAVETAEKEARERAKIARQLRIARIMGSSLGNQLDMFLEPDRTPAAEIAFGEGERDALANKPAKPKYDPSTEQARKYLEGYHSISEKRIKDGIGKKDPEAAALAEKETEAKVKVDTQKAEDAKTFDAPKDPPPADPKPMPQSGTPMTRAQFKAKMDAEKTAAAGK